MHEHPLPFEGEFPAEQLSQSSLEALNDFVGLPKGDILNLKLTDKPNGASEVVFHGELRKKNKFRMRQLRFFTLAADGEVQYFKG